MSRVIPEYRVWLRRLSTARFYSNASHAEYDVTVVGGGILGTATARRLLILYPKLRVILLEKENVVGFHQTGHNSGVIHAGVYYVPGSLKAKLCVEGLHLSYKYCDEKKIPYKKCGKLIVAVDESELDRLQALYERGMKNNVPDIQMVGVEKIKEIEPHCNGIKAIWSPHTGIVDWGQVCRSYADDFTKSGGTIQLGFEVSDFSYQNRGSDSYPVVIMGTQGENIRCRYVITCGGLQSDRLAVKSGCSSNPQIVPFRGEYLLLSPDKCRLIKGNIYPVPNPNFPFLGVHFTPRMDGSVWLGPNAVLAFKREGYSWADFNFKDLLQTLKYSGFQKLMTKYFSFGLGEMFRSFYIAAQVNELRKYVPHITRKDVIRGPAGVRAQAMTVDGQLVDDFVFDGGEGELGACMLHVRNAPSPGATSSLAIAKMITEKAANKFHLQ